MTSSERNDKKALMYLKENGITDINQVTEADREILYSILDEKLP